MTPEEVKKRYDSTIGRFVSVEKNNPLCGVRIEGFGGSGKANVHLSIDGRQSDRDKASQFRFVVRQYFDPTLKRGEHLRCWLGISRDPRVDICLNRKKDLLSCQFDNDDAVELIRHWCSEAGVDAS